MIKACELRVGNLVMVGDHVTEVEDIIGERGINWMYIDDLSGPEFRFSEINPIPLTPEILEKCGLIRGKESTDRNVFYSTGAHKIAFQITLSGWFLFGDKKQLLPVPYGHLHQVQNLYFALTGEELAYKW